MVTIGTAPGSAPAVAPTDKNQNHRGVFSQQKAKVLKRAGAEGEQEEENTTGTISSWMNSPTALVAVVGAAAAPGAIPAVPAPAPAPRVAPGPATRREHN